MIKPSKPAGCPISEVIAELKAWGSNAVIDDDFAVEAGIDFCFSIAFWIL